jgi:hypothetical protein
MILRPPLKVYSSEQDWRWVRWAGPVACDTCGRFVTRGLKLTERDFFWRYCGWPCARMDLHLSEM